MDPRLRKLGLVLLGAAALGAVAALVLKDQARRHRRNLFNPNAFRRLAALSHMAREHATVDGIMLLRDFTAWEPRSILRGRARAILNRMERELRHGPATLEPSP